MFLTYNSVADDRALGMAIEFYDRRRNCWIEQDSTQILGVSVVNIAQAKHSLSVNFLYITGLVMNVLLQVRIPKKWDQSIISS